MEKKYKFTEETRIYNGRLLHRIVAIRDFSYIQAGEKGGWIEKEDNLSHEGNCWVSDNAIVCNKACVYDNAKVAGNAHIEKCGQVSGEAFVGVNARITDYASVYDDARVSGNALVGGRAIVCRNSMIDMDAVIDGNAYIGERARVFYSAHVTGFSHVGNNACVKGNAIIYEGIILDQVVIEGNAHVAGSVTIDGKAHICGNAVIEGKEDFIVFKNWWSSGRYFTWTRSNDKYKVGCFYGTGKELIEAAYNDSKEKGREYERIVNYVNSIKNDGKQNDITRKTESDSDEVGSAEGYVGLQS